MVLMHVAIPKAEEALYAKGLLDDTYFGPIYPEAHLSKIQKQTFGE
jgi:hypothetical protein